jgi:hypothetical protein
MQVFSLFPIVAVLELAFTFSETYDQRHSLSDNMNHACLFKLKLHH